MKLNRNLYLDRNKLFLGKCLDGAKGVIHVGAQFGTEAAYYNELGLNAAFIEANTETYLLCKQTVSDYPNQIALNCLITDKPGENRDFYISNELGGCSSIFDLHLIKQWFPAISVDRIESFASESLDNLVETGVLDINLYDTLVLDVHGAEVLAMQGFANNMNHINCVIAEASTFEAFKNGCLLRDITAYMHSIGFIEVSRHSHSRSELGSYFDVEYRRYK